MMQRARASLWNIIRRTGTCLSSLVDRKSKSPFALAGAGTLGLPAGRHGALEALGKTARGALGRECTRLEVCNSLHSAYVTSEALRYSVGLVECVALLAGTGWRDGGWVGRKFQVVKDLADDLTLRDDRDDPQHALLTPRAAGHIQRKDPLQQPRPAPARRWGARLRLGETLLASRRDDTSAQVAVRRQTAAIAHQMDVWQG